MIPSFAERQQQWSNPPVDDIGYLSSSDMLAMTDGALGALIERAERNRYGGWRNYRNRWRDVLGLDTTHGERVLDYGCGIGIEALQYARAGNAVTLADISRDNTLLANRVLTMYGYPGSLRVWGVKPHRMLPNEAVDIVHCAGVLHHIPDPVPVIEHLHRVLTAAGELRLMVYSDQAWRIAVGTEPPDDVLADPGFERYWQHWDAVGGYADWYNQARLEERFGEWFYVERCEPLTEHGEYLGAVLVKRS